MSTFFDIKVARVQRETDDAVSVYFEIPEDRKADFAYKAGQYITIEMNVQGENVRRAYSLCTSPLSDPQPAVTVKKVQGGRMSVYLNTTLKAGDVLKLMPPEGRFTPEINASAKKQYILFAGGSGITPMMSILKTVLQSEPQSIIHLVYANRSKNTVIFKDQLEQFEKSHKGRFEVTHVYDSAGLFFSGIKGPLTVDTVKKIYSKVRREEYTADIFICGPAGMMDAVKNGLFHTNLSDEQIHIEYFTAPVSGNSGAAAQANAAGTAQPATGGNAEVELTLGGTTHNLSVGPRKTILAAAQDAGLDPPYSCEAGICSTCMAKVTEGSVRMIENNILTQKEVDAGFVLTCQAICTSPKVKIEFFD